MSRYLPRRLFPWKLTIRQRPVDLAQVSQLVLFDLGATLQILRRAGREKTVDGRLKRIEDCIVEIGMGACLEALAQCPIARRSPALLLFISAWQRARETAFIARFVAESSPWTSLKRMPIWSAWPMALATCLNFWSGIAAGKFGSDSDLTGLRIAEAWRLPHCIAEYFLDRMAGKSQTQWTKIVDCALELLESRPSTSLSDNSIASSFQSVQKIPDARGPATSISRLLIRLLIVFA